MRKAVVVVLALATAHSAHAAGDNRDPATGPEEGRVGYWELSANGRRLDWLSAPIASPRLGLALLTLECSRPGALKAVAPGIEYLAPSGAPPIGTPMVLDLRGDRGTLETFEAPVLAWQVRADASSPQTAYFAPSYKYRRIGEAKTIGVRFGPDSLTVSVPGNGLWRRFVDHCAAL